MGGSSVFFFLLILLALCMMVYGMFAAKRSAIVGIIASAVVILSVGGAFYAWSESQSVPWTIGYGLFAAIAAFSATRQFVRPKTKGEQVQES